MKIIFLDIDGVLNNETVWGRKVILQECMDVLNEIVRITGAAVVVTSLYRVDKTVYELKKFLEAKGFKGRVIDKTPELKGGKGPEIDLWLKKNREVDSHVILEDDPYGFEEDENLVFIDSKKGLTRAYTDRIVEILNQ